MRIGMDAFALDTGASSRNAGVSRVVAYVVPALATASPNDEFHAWIHPNCTPPESWSGHDNLTIHRIWPKFRTWNLVGEPLMGLKHRLDLWLSLANRIPRWMPCPRMLLMYDLFPIRSPENYPDQDLIFYRREFEYGCKNARHLFSISEYTKREIVDVYGVSPDKITPVPLGTGNPVERRTYDSVSTDELRSMNVPFDRYIFTLSTLEPRKNLPRLVEAFAKVTKNLALSDVGLVIGGGKGWKEGAVYETIKQLGIEDKIVFLGFVPSEHLPALFGRAEVYITPSIDEGFGLPLLEAMLIGAPVVSSNAGSLLEVGGDVATYFDPLNVDDMAARIEEFLLATHNREALIAKGLEQAKKFTWEACAEVMLKGIRQSLGR
ncbi:MAG TPA: glycosyltransferase family 1 protein [Fimbriimonadaceae bacterium]|nr:glycosyltransferase family 1 protein [Fimbriimonadaceae bacterium]